MINILYYKTEFDLEYENRYLAEQGYNNITLFAVEEGEFLFLRQPNQEKK